MFSFVAFVARSQPLPQTTVYERIRAHFQDWGQALDEPRVAVRFLAEKTRFQARTVRSRDAVQCVLGLDFAAVGFAAGESPLTAPRQLVERYGGYVSIYIDATTEAVSVLRDPTGRIPCWRMELDDVDVFFSDFRDVRSLLRRPPTINWDYLAYHLRNDWLWGSATGLNEVTEIQPGGVIDLAPEAAPKIRQLWRPDEIAALPYATLGEAADALRTAAEHVVADWSKDYGTIVLMLSGGLDSAIVLGLLRRQSNPANVIGLNLFVEDRNGDERTYAHDAARLHGIEVHDVQFSLDDPDAPPDFAHRLMRPTMKMLPGGLDQLGSRMMQAVGADCHMTGAAGDHIFMAATKSHVGGDYWRINGVQGLVPTCHRMARACGDTVWSVLSHALKEPWRSPPRFQDLVPLGNAYLPCEEAGIVFDDYAPETLKHALARTPPAKLDQIMYFCELQRHYHRLSFADVAEEIHPLFSQPLLEVSLRIPVYWFFDGFMQRSLARQVFGDLLPESILNRRSKSTTQTHVGRMFRRDGPANTALMLDGELVKHGLVDREKITAALAPSGTAALADFPGFANCLTTEMWVQATQAANQSVH